LPVADFSGVVFDAPASFNTAGFKATTWFEGASFAAGANFANSEFAGEADFQRARFGGSSEFHAAFFRGPATFVSATFLGKSEFRQTWFRQAANFALARIEDVIHFWRVTAEAELFLSVDITDAGLLRLTRVGAEGADPPHSSALILFEAMSLARVELRDLDASRFRFRQAVDIERLALIGEVRWPRRGHGYLVGDQIDLEREGDSPRRPSPREVERICTALRKNHEDRNDRFGAHGWYWAEMEIGRLHPQTRLTRIARTFYRLTSDYGLSAVRPALWLLASAVSVISLYMIPWAGLCPASNGNCVGWEETIKVVLLALFLQPPPEGVSLQGLAGQVIWLMMRLFGAAMLFSIALAFRNQVAR
jgi:hypothetical protein